MLGCSIGMNGEPRPPQNEPHTRLGVHHELFVPMYAAMTRLPHFNLFENTFRVRIRGSHKNFVKEIIHDLNTQRSMLM